MDSNVKFTASKAESQTILKIIKRYETIMQHRAVDRLTLLMDLEACHCNGCPIDLMALHECASDGDLVHDVGGIYQHLDRETGHLTDHFHPRYAASHALADLPS